MPNFTDFENRLAKNYKHIAKWARRQDITCFRVYDNDIPEFPLAIDLYGNCLHVAEYRRKHNLSPEEYEAWLQKCSEICLAFFSLMPENLFVKWRDKQQGTTQYEKFDNRQVVFKVRENNLWFEVNLSDYLDTGLFLDHRPTRQMLQKNAEAMHILNLFAYTGSFSVYAAAGNAASTTTIDLSNTYLQWAQRNMALNGFTNPKKHQFIQADVVQWLRETPKKNQYDRIVLDPPTFSNSKRMAGILDIQRDHSTLINQALSLLKKGGQLYFSTNCRSFRLDRPNIDVPAEWIKDISKQSIPEDFRNKKIHECYLIQIAH